MELLVKYLSANAGDISNAGSIPGWKTPLEESIATHSCILAWRTPWTEEPGRLYIVQGVTKSQTRLK